MRLWLTKEAGTTLSRKVDGGEQGTYTYWDPDSWEKQRKELTVIYSDLEEKQNPEFQGRTLQSAQQMQTQQQQLQTHAQMQQAPGGPRSTYQGMSVAV